MVSLLNWKRCAWLALLPLYACAPLQSPPPQQACAHQAGMQTQDYCYAVTRPHAANDYPVSYRVQAQGGRATAVDRHVLDSRSSMQRLLDQAN